MSRVVGFLSLVAGVIALSGIWEILARGAHISPADRAYWAGCATGILAVSARVWRP